MHASPPRACFACSAGPAHLETRVPSNTWNLSQVPGEDALVFQKIDFPPLPLPHYWHVHAYRSHREFVFVSNFIFFGGIFGFFSTVTLAVHFVFSHSHGQIDGFGQTDSSPEGTEPARFILRRVRGTRVADGGIGPSAKYPSRHREYAMHHMSLRPQCSISEASRVSPSSFP